MHKTHSFYVHRTYAIKIWSFFHYYALHEKFRCFLCIRLYIHPSIYFVSEIIHITFTEAGVKNVQTII